MVIKNTLHPVWGYDLSIPQWCVGDALRVQVWDKDFITFDDFLGEVVLSLEEALSYERKCTANP
tara:strand:+ start:283 stop:474 length:192 start_codon:yes stop_codon:yes gene_type:complete